MVQDSHPDKILEAAVDVTRLATHTFVDETETFVAAPCRFVVGEDLEFDPVEPEVAKCVVDERTDSIAAMPLPSVRVVADDDTELRAPMAPVDPVQPAGPHEPISDDDCVDDVGL